jgi:hypothetical protein
VALHAVQGSDEHRAVGAVVAHYHQYLPTIVEGLDQCRCGSTRPASQPTPTSEEAAAQIAPSVSGLRRRVYEFVRQKGLVTDEQICNELGLNPSTARPRRIELVQVGLIRNSGKVAPTASGRSAVLWTAA